MDESFLKVEEVHEAMETLKYISADDEIRAISDLRQKTINDRNSEMTVAREEGLAEGREEGREEAKREAALKMMKKYIDLVDISEFTGLTIEELEKLR
jgi:predicted transposase/invertase (TIGR01784 family)